LCIPNDVDLYDHRLFVGGTATIQSQSSRYSYFYPFELTVKAGGGTVGYIESVLVRGDDMAVTPARTRLRSD
jgi:hypothetical protein